MSVKDSRHSPYIVWVLGVLSRIRRDTIGMDAEIARVEERIHAGEVRWTGKAPFTPGPGRGNKPPRG